MGIAMIFLIFVLFLLTFVVKGNDDNTPPYNESGL